MLGNYAIGSTAVAASYMTTQGAVEVVITPSVPFSWGNFTTLNDKEWKRLRALGYQGTLNDMQKAAGILNMGI